MLRVSLPIPCAHARCRRFLSTRRLPFGSSATLLAHRIPPGKKLCTPRGNQLIEAHLHFIQQHCANQLPCLVLVAGEREEFCFKVSAGDGITFAPAHEEQVGGERASSVAAGVGDDLYTVGCAVASL